MPSKLGYAGWGDRLALLIYTQKMEKAVEANVIAPKAAVAAAAAPASLPHMQEFLTQREAERAAGYDHVAAHMARVEMEYNPPQPAGNEHHLPEPAVMYRQTFSGEDIVAGSSGFSNGEGNSESIGTLPASSKEESPKTDRERYIERLKATLINSIPSKKGEVEQELTIQTKQTPAGEGASNAVGMVAIGATTAGATAARATAARATAAGATTTRAITAVVTTAGIGELPSGWEQLHAPEGHPHFGHPYFVNHNNGTTTWADPRLATPAFQTMQAPVNEDVLMSEDPTVNITQEQARKDVAMADAPAVQMEQEPAVENPVAEEEPRPRTPAFTFEITEGYFDTKVAWPRLDYD